MWTLNNDTPFAAERNLICDNDGRAVWVVAVKGTFLIHPEGTTELAPEQEPVRLEPGYFGDPALSSLLYESDLEYTKPGTDITLNGHAYAPHGKPIQQLDVTVTVGPIHKTVRAFGDRWWDKGAARLKLSSPEPFTKMPITYERAFGGVDQNRSESQTADWEKRNPIGTGFASKRNHAAGKIAPNIEDPSQLIRSWQDRPAPAGYGAIARSWSPRREKAGTYDSRWETERHPLLPLDFDPAFYHCAPADQQIPEYLRGGEPVALVNLSKHRVLKFHLPRVALSFSTLMGEKRVAHRSVLHSVILEPDFPRVIMVWHSSLYCQGMKLSLKATDITQKRIVSKGGAA